MMASFHELQIAVPDLADRARAVLSSTTNGVLATIRRDGTPRLSGIDPFVLGGDLCIASMPGARKAQDLRRDPRMALHSIPWDSRRIRDNVEDPGDMDVKLNGIATLTTDPDVVRSLRELLKAERDLVPPETADLFTIGIESLTLLSVSGEYLIVDRWSAAEGRRTVRRTYEEANAIQ